MQNMRLGLSMAIYVIVFYGNLFRSEKHLYAPLYTFPRGCKDRLFEFLSFGFIFSIAENFCLEMTLINSIINVGLCIKSIFTPNLTSKTRFKKTYIEKVF